MTGMTKKQKIVTWCIIAMLFLVIAWLFIGMRVASVDGKCLDWLETHKALFRDDDYRAYYGLIEYDLLSDEYKALFTKEEYEGVSTDDEFYELITKVNSISPKVRKSDIFITGWRNYLSANLYTSHGTYRIDYDIWMRPNYLTGSYKISKWDVTVNELDKEE